MRFLLTEKRVKIRKDFQKLLNNAIQMYGISKEEIIFKTEDIILFKEVQDLKSKEQCSLDYHCYWFLDVKKPFFQNKDIIQGAYDHLSGLQNMYRSWATPEPFMNHLRTDYDKLDSLSLVFIAFSYSDTISEEFFAIKGNEICNNMESKILSYVLKTKNAFEILIQDKYYSL